MGENAVQKNEQKILKFYNKKGPISLLVTL